jgi:hypothetical protein
VPTASQEHVGSIKCPDRPRQARHSGAGYSGERTLAQATYQALRSTRRYHEIGLWPTVELSEGAIKALVEAIHEIQVSDTDEQQT